MKTDKHIHVVVVVVVVINNYLASGQWRAENSVVPWPSVVECVLPCHDDVFAAAFLPAGTRT